MNLNTNSKVIKNLEVIACSLSLFWSRQKFFLDKI